MPPHDRLRLHYDQAVSPTVPQMTKRDEEDAVAKLDAWPWNAALQYCELLTQREVFNSEFSARDEQRTKQMEQEHARGIGSNPEKTSARAGSAHAATKLSPVSVRGQGFRDGQRRSSRCEQESVTLRSTFGCERSR